METGGEERADLTMSEQHWSVTVATPVGPREGTLVLHRAAGAWIGEVISGNDTMSIANIQWSGMRLRWEQTLTGPVQLKLRVDVTVDGDRLTGTARDGPFLSSQVAGYRSA